MTAHRHFLFLDFDCTTHPLGCTPDRYFCRLKPLEAWLRVRPGVAVVISSSWRESHPLDEMHSYFSTDVQARVVGPTPVLKRDPWAQWDGEMSPPRFDREVEVLRWLHDNATVRSSWVTLEDHVSLYRPCNNHLVVCDGRIGLIQRDLDRVDAALGTQA
jgi:hypothetical protein